MGPDGVTDARGYLERQQDFGRFLAMANRLSRTQADAEDLLQEALRRVLAANTDPKSPAQWFRYIETTISNVQRELWASQARRATTTGHAWGPGGDEDVPDFEPDPDVLVSGFGSRRVGQGPEALAVENELALLVADVTSALPPPQGDVALLTLEGLTQGQVAQVLSDRSGQTFTVEQVKTLRRAAMNALRSAVRQYLQGGERDGRA